MNNPLNLIRAFRNPDNFLKNLSSNQQAMQNPIMSNAMQMYRNGNSQGLKEIAENLCRQRGITPEEMAKQLGLK